MRLFQALALSVALGAVALSALALGAGSAAADGPQFDKAADLAALDACLDANFEDRRACIRSIMHPCVDSTPAPDDGMMAWKELDMICADREASAWDAMLNRDYKALRAKVDEWNPGTGDSLRDAQRAWLAFYEKECAWPLDFLRGNNAHHADIACRIEMLAERAIDLHEWLEFLE